MGSMGTWILICPFSSSTLVERKKERIFFKLFLKQHTALTALAMKPAQDPPKDFFFLATSNFSFYGTSTSWNVCIWCYASLWWNSCLLFVSPGGVPPIPHPGKASGLLPLQGHLCDSIQSTGLPRPALVSEHRAATVLSAQKTFDWMVLTSCSFSPAGLNQKTPPCWRSPPSKP